MSPLRGHHCRSPLGRIPPVQEDLDYRIMAMRTCYIQGQFYNSHLRWYPFLYDQVESYRLRYIYIYLTILENGPKILEFSSVGKIMTRHCDLEGSSRPLVALDRPIIHCSVTASETRYAVAQR